MLATIIERAAALKAGRAVDRKSAAKSDDSDPQTQDRRLRNSPNTATTRTARKPAAKTAAKPRPFSQRKHAHEEIRRDPVQRRRARSRGRVRRVRRAPRHRGSELHLRRPQHRPAPRRPRPQSRGAAGGRRQPRVRVTAHAPALHRQSADPQSAADRLVSDQQRPGDLRRRRHPGRRYRARRDGLGRRVREAVQQAAVRLRSGEGRLVRMERRDLDAAHRHADRDASALHRHGHAPHPGERAAGDRGADDEVVRIDGSGPRRRKQDQE